MSRDVIEQRIKRAIEAAAKEQMRSFKSPATVHEFDTILENLNAALDILENMNRSR
jgi:hypothetical protein